MIVNNKNKIKHKENNMVKKQLRKYNIKMDITVIKIEKKKIKIYKYS